MARLPRLYFEGCAQHVIQRGNNRGACFFTAADRKAYLTFLLEASIQYRVSIHAFVLMTNHVHLLVTPSDKIGVARMMQSLGRRYVQRFNFRHDRTGTLWEGRYRSTLVDSEHYVMRVYRYIELNPVRAGMVTDAADYPWSSYQHNAEGKVIRLVDPHEQYLMLGQTNAERRQEYRLLFRGMMGEQTLKDIRNSTNKGWPLGTAGFKEEVRIRTGRQVLPTARGGDRKSRRYAQKSMGSE